MYRRQTFGYILEALLDIYIAFLNINQLMFIEKIALYKPNITSPGGECGESQERETPRDGVINMFAKRGKKFNYFKFL